MKLGELRQLTRQMPSLQGPELQQWLQEQILCMGMDPNAIYQELEMTSRYVDTHRDISFTNSHTQLHSHSFYELLFCCNSCGAEFLVGPERYRLQAGDIIFIPPGVSHRPLLPQAMVSPYQRYVLWLSPEFMELYAKLYSHPFSERQAYPNILRPGAEDQEQLGSMFQAGIQEAEQQRDGWEAAVMGNTLQLLTRIKRVTDARSARRMQAEKPELLDRITTYIETNYSRQITVAGLGRQFFVSSSTVSHLFQQRLGVSVYRYVTQRRLIAAKSLIAHNLRLEDVAAQTGFCDYSAFYRAFKQEYGISPREYRGLQDVQNRKP